MQLPQDMMIEIFKNLDLIDLIKSSYISKYWNLCSKNNELWKHLFIGQFINHKIDSKITWLENYKLEYRSAMNCFNINITTPYPHLTWFEKFSSVNRYKLSFGATNVEKKYICVLYHIETNKDTVNRIMTKFNLTTFTSRIVEDPFSYDRTHNSFFRNSKGYYFWKTMFDNIISPIFCSVRAATVYARENFSNKNKYSLDQNIPINDITPHHKAHLSKIYLCF